MEAKHLTTGSLFKKQLWELLFSVEKITLVHQYMSFLSPDSHFVQGSSLDPQSEHSVTSTVSTLHYRVKEICSFRSNFKLSARKPCVKMRNFVSIVGFF